MEDVVAILTDIHNALGDVIVGMKAGLIAAENSTPKPEIDPEECNHEHKQNVAGAGMGSKLMACVDCGKEL